jgi:hypothetical protein
MAGNTERLAKALVWTDSGSQAGEIASLRAAIASGQTIYANDLNRIGTLINNMNGHYHTYDDYWQIPTFGNNGDRTTYGPEDKNTNSIDAVITAPTDTASNTTITASRHNELKTALNVLAYHLHGIDDRTE